MKNWKHKSIIKLAEETGNDPITAIRQRARDLVVYGLENGWVGPPFDAIQLAKILNFDIAPNDSISDARIIPIGGNKFKIEFNPFQRPTRMNFSIAHELAHTLLSDCKESVRNREEDPTENRELEQVCNIGASEIQLPYAVFSSDANELENVDLESLIRLSTKYKASLESLFIRFVEVIDLPCAIMICRFNQNDSLTVEYSKASRLFKPQIPKNISIPKNSNAYECTAPGWTSRETVKWDFLRNDECEIYSIGLTPMRGDDKARVGIVIVPSKQLEKLHERKIKLEYGDATKPRGNGVKIIAQVVNTSGGLGLGFGKSLAKNFPEVKSELKKWMENKVEFQLGNTNCFQVRSDIYIFQLLAQKGLFAKEHEIPLKYSHLRKCLSDLAHKAIELNASVHMPMIGAGQAKGDWNIILGIIHDEIISKGLNVNIYMLPGKVPNIKLKSSLTLFKEESTWVNEKLF